MDGNNTQVSRRIHPLGHGFRSSVASVFRRKGLALVSLSTRLRGSRSARRDSTGNYIWTTHNEEETPTFCHMENITRHGSLSDMRNKVPQHRRRNFWTVSGTRSRSRPSIGVQDCSTDTEYSPRMSRARSFVQSLRRRREDFQEDYTSDSETVYKSCDMVDSPEETAPTLDMPSGCADEAEPRSDFALGVRKAVQDTVDETFSLRSPCATLRERSVSGPELSQTDGSDLDSPRSPQTPITTFKDVWTTVSPRTKSTDKPKEISEHRNRNPEPIHMSMSPCWTPLNDKETQKPSDQTVIQTVLRAFEDLSADLKSRKDATANAASHRNLDVREEKLRNLRSAIESLAETLSPGGDIQIPMKENNTQVPTEENQQKYQGQKTQEPAENERPSIETERTDSTSSDSSNWAPDGEDFDISENQFGNISGFTSLMSSEDMGDGPLSPATSAGGSLTLERIPDEQLWEMQCTKYIMEVLMKKHFRGMNPDAWEEESTTGMTESDSTRRSLQDELLQAGESCDGDDSLVSVPLTEGSIMNEDTTIGDIGDQ